MIKINICEKIIFICKYPVKSFTPNIPAIHSSEK